MQELSHLFFAANAGVIFVLQVVVEALDDDANTLHRLEAGLPFVLVLVVGQGVPDGLQQDGQAGAGQALFPVFGWGLIFVDGFLFEDIQHRQQVGLQQPLSGARVGFEDEGAQGFPEFVQVGVERRGGESFRDFEGIFVKGVFQLDPGFVLFAGGFEALMSDKGAGFLEQGFGGPFFNQKWG